MCLQCLRKMNSEDGQVYYVCILQFSCFTKYNRMQSKHKQTKCEHSRRNSYGLQIFQQVSLYYIKELFKKTISNSSLNFHVYWDTLQFIISGFYLIRSKFSSLFFYGVPPRKDSKARFPTVLLKALPDQV